MSPIVYVDTSVIGGVFDVEFELWTNLFFKAVHKGEFRIGVSSILKDELLNAPTHVSSFLDKFEADCVIDLALDKEAIHLADQYLKSGIVGKGSLADCRHIATATVNKIDILASWNFKHIVNLNKIKHYNGINIQNGYGILEIRTPRELIDYGNRG
tara:strand:- start:225 stop:692 length:468 start_codon:yes stop_codon:yes gene_type:complete